MSRLPNVRTPRAEEVATIAKELGFSFSEEDVQSFTALLAGPIASYNRLDELVEPKLPVKYSRMPGHRPKFDENPLNAWAWKAEVKGAAKGQLEGKTIALKDNISLAGVPMSNGTSIMEGFVPDIDATVVTRILDAGGTVSGKAAVRPRRPQTGCHSSVRATWCTYLESVQPIRNLRRSRSRGPGGWSRNSAVKKGSRVSFRLGLHWFTDRVGEDERLDV